MEDEETDSPPPPPPTGDDLKEDFDDQKEAAIPHQTPRTPSPPATGNDSKEEVDNQKETAAPHHHHRTPATKAPPATVPTPFVTQTFLEGEEENFMTLSPKEKAAWIKMIKTRHASLVKKEQEHKKWKDSMMERRVTVYNRSKKLLSAQRDRFRFLFKVAEVVKQLSDNKENENDGDEDDKDKENDGVVNDNGNDDNNADNVDDVINTNNNTDDNKSAENDDENVQRLDAVPTILVNGPTQ